jgi:hypothetical protein
MSEKEPGTEEKPSKWSQLPGYGQTNENGKDDDNKRTEKIYFRATPTEKAEIQELVKKSELSEQKYLLASALGQFRKGYKPLKSDGMVRVPNWDPNMTCIYCGRIIQLSEYMFFKEGVAAVCSTCHFKIQMDTMDDPAFAKRTLSIVGMEETFRTMKKIAQPLYREVYKILQITESFKTYNEILNESATDRAQTCKILNSLILEKHLVPDKEFATAFLEDDNRRKQQEENWKRRIWEIEHNPISVAKIEELLAMPETETQYAIAEIEIPQLEKKRKNEDSQSEGKSDSEGT